MPSEPAPERKGWKSLLCELDRKARVQQVENMFSLVRRVGHTVEDETVLLETKDTVRVSVTVECKKEDLEGALTDGFNGLMFL